LAPAVTQRRGGRRALRLLAGLLISGAFVVATVARVDLGEVLVAMSRVDPAGLAVAVVLVALELIVRALRWQGLLAPVVRVPLRRSVAYLSIGYFANSMLPARLGDLARAHLAGRSFGVARLTVLGTIVVERLADGLFILLVVATLGVLVAGGQSLASTALWLAVLAAIAGAGLIVALVYVRSSGGGPLRMSARALLERVLRGADGIRTPRGFVQASVLTAAAFAVAVAMFAVVASAGRVELSLAQCALAMGGLALSTSIPAAPGSIGTYEFVGLTILESFGLAAETALAIVLLVHLVATLPVAIAGLVSTWLFHFRVSEITEDAEPSLLAPEARSTASDGDG
jgi:uncharacterized membrane protein YbhN (UPF0104 family)